MHIAIVGAGAAGLCAAKYSLEEGHSCEVFEQTGLLGGTWNYTDNVGVDENGIPVHTAMYKDLRTNLPKEVMTYMNFPYPDKKISFIYQEEVLDYIKSYAKTYDLERVIKYYHQVISVDTMQNKKWSVKVRDVLTKKEDTKIYDAIMVCNGHYSVPKIPTLDGIENFKGLILHSHDYRKPDPFTGKSVLIVGAGPSGVDITGHLAKVAKKVYLSYRQSFKCMKFPENVIRKGLVEKVNGNSVSFENGPETYEVDAIMYCTGYQYVFPFLSESCKIKVVDNQVWPLYKHIINIEHPTMGFIGLLYQVTPFPVFDIQTRFFLAFLKSPNKLPSKEDMLKHLKTENTERELKGIPKTDAHEIGFLQEMYCNDLAQEANVRFFLETLKNQTILPSKEAMFEDLKEDIQICKKLGLPEKHAHYGGEAYQPLYIKDLANIANIKPIPNVISKIFCKNKCSQTEECFKIVDEDNYEILP